LTVIKEILANIIEKRNDEKVADGGGFGESFHQHHAIPSS